MSKRKKIQIPHTQSGPQTLKEPIMNPLVERRWKNTN